MTLVETLTALAILGIVAVVFLTGLSVSSSAVMVSQKRVAAESLAKSQSEYIKNSTYDDTNNPPVYTLDPNLTTPDGYSIPPPTAERLDPDGDGLGDDDGLQKITVTVNRNADLLLTLVDYKVNR